METIPEMLTRRLKNTEGRLKDAKAYKERAIAELTAKCDREIGIEEGRVATYENLLELDWKLYSEITLGAK